MNKRYKKQRKSLLIFFLIIPLIASWATSKYMFNKISNRKTIKAVKIDLKDETKKQIDGFEIYSIQVGSVNDHKEVENIVNNLQSSSIPSYVHKKEGAYKVYTYVSLEESNVRKYLENIRSSYSDAFISKVEVGSIDLEYTKKYEYMNVVCKNLNLMIENMKQESKFWNEYKSGISNYNDYIEIINNKSKIVDSLTNNSKKIKGKDAEHFEKKLSEFCEWYKVNIESVNENLGNGNLKSCEKLFLSSLFKYNEFINKI
ncbi:SPOR domain-containing protein [Tepidibacter sp. Z1-5]|uniref:SPOR domain-containing protein n=1 Tax=Tepidibacter sp. Z1-5 TaxID=3134138 RepID=UPI0030C0751F